MEPISFFDRIKMLFKIVSGSSFFIILFAIAIFTLIILIINVKSKNKTIKIITASVYGIVVILALIKYWQALLSLGDTIVDKIFTAVYFPNYISYICMMIISILLIILVITNKKISSFGKYGSILSFSFIIFLFILTLETIMSNNIVITSKTSIYSNETLVILIQTSTIIFTIWIVFYLIGSVVSLIDKKINSPIIKEKINKDIFNKLRIENMDAFINLEDPSEMNDSEFEEALHKYKKKNEYKDIMKITKLNKK